MITWVHSRLVMPWQARRFQRIGSLEDIILAGGKDDRAERGWHQVERSLGTMKQLCDARKVLLRVVILPRRDQVSGSNHHQAYNGRARTVAERLGIDAYDVLPELAAAYRLKGDALFIPWDGHNSAVANEVIATRLAHEFTAVVSRLGSR